MKVKFTFEMRTVYKNGLALMGHHTTPSGFEFTHMLLQNNFINNGATNGLQQKKEKSM